MKGGFFMKIQYLGTAAAEGVPAIFCNCENCKRSRLLGGRNIRTRSQAIIDNAILIDFPADTYMHYLRFNFPLYKIKTCLITHAHSDHLYERDIVMRCPGFANISGNPDPITFYSDTAGFEKITEEIKHIPPEAVVCKKIKLFKPMNIGGYIVTALRATHDAASSPVLYIIERDGKSIFYSHDTAPYGNDTYNYLKSLKKPFSFVSFDCDEGCLKNQSARHMSLWQCIDMKKQFINDGIADENTIFVLNHFSHNATGVVYDDFSKTAEKYGFLTSYDGMVAEF